MTLTYTWNIEHTSFDSSINYVAAGYYEPHYKTEVGEVEYEYDVTISPEDIYEYLLGNTKAPSQSYNQGFFNACEELFRLDLLRIDDLEDDEDFIEFMKDKYEEEALEKYYEEN